MTETKVRLNDVELAAYNLQQRTEERRGRERRVWSFELDATGDSQADSLNELLQSDELQLRIAADQTRVDKGTYSYSFPGRPEGPRTRYHYSLEFFELFEGEEPDHGGWAVVAQAIADSSRAVFDRRIEPYEERLRAIEQTLEIDNSQYVRRYEEKIDREAAEGWLKRWPETARDLSEISKTERVQAVLESLPPEDPASEQTEGEATEVPP